MAKTKTIRTTEKTWKDLKDMCNTLEQKANGVVEVTVSDSIDVLLKDYIWKHSDEYKTQQEVAIKNQYISKQKHETIIEAMEIEYETEKRNRLPDKPTTSVKDINLQLEKQIQVNEELQSVVVSKDNELSLLKSEVTNLLKKQAELEQLLKQNREQYNTLVDKHNEHLHNTDTFFFQLDALETLYYIARFLKRYPKRLFTIEEIHDKLRWKQNLPSMIIEDFRYSLVLTKYKVLPIRCVDTRNGESFQYDRRYLH